jgi:hypothetical protein
VKLKLTNDYEELAVECQYQMICLLRDKLRKFGVAGDAVKNIVGESVFDFSIRNRADARASVGLRCSEKSEMDAGVYKDLCRPGTVIEYATIYKGQQTAARDRGKPARVSSNVGLRTEDMAHEVRM